MTAKKKKLEQTISKKRKLR